MAAVTLRRNCPAIGTGKFIFSEVKRISNRVDGLYCHFNKEKIFPSKMKGSVFFLRAWIPEVKKILLNHNTSFYLSQRELSVIQSMKTHLSADQDDLVNELRKHPKKKFISEDVVNDTINFLKQKGFQINVIRETPTICFYPKENIEAGFKELEKNESHLNKMGFIKGFKVEKSSHDFPNAPRLLDSRLQLCLYYMELPFGFNGGGIFSINENMQ